MQNLILVVLGKKGSGKSTLTRELVAERERVVVIDSLAEYGKECGCEEHEGLDDCLDALEDAEERRKFKLSLRCLAVQDNLDLLNCCYELPETLIVVEETSLYCSPTQLPDELAQLVRYGRHRGIDQCYVARRASEVHRDLTANADVLVTFRQQEPRDLIYLRSFYGDRALELQSLPDYHVRVFGDLERCPRPILYRLAQQKD